MLHNGDLEGRILEVPVEPWENGDFENVINLGSGILNVTFPAYTRRVFIENTYGNIGMLQEFLKVFCRLNGVDASQSSLKLLENGAKTEQTFETKLESQKGRLLRVLEGIAGKSRTDGDDPLILPYYLIVVLLKTPIAELREGIRRQDLLEKMRSVHHRVLKETIRTSDISHLLKRLPTHQQEMQPPFLHYDSNQQRLKIVDTSQFFALSRLNREVLLEEISYPLNTYE